MRYRDLVEAFDNPYKGKWEKSDYGDVDLNTKLPDGTNLNIMFNQEYDGEGEEVTHVEFHRNNSQDVTGEGDAQRIFATVLDAIQKYIKKYKPERLSFSASKSVDMDADDVERFNPESRAKLYDRLVQRYARAWGYRASRADNGDIVIYELSRLKQGMAEDQVHEADASTVQFQTASTDNYQSSFTVTAIADGKNVGHFSFFRDPETDDVHNQAEVTDDVRGKGYGKALLLKAIEVANDHGLGFQEDSQSLSRAQSRVYDSLYDAGWIVDADGYWFLTPEGEQELARLSTIQQGVAEGKQPGKPVVDAILKVIPVTQEIWFHGSRATGRHRRNSDTDILVVIPDDLVGDQYLAVVRILQKLASHFDNYDIQPTKSGTNIHRIAQEEGRLLWSSKQGVAEGSENFNGIDIDMEIEGDEIMVRAMANGRELGHVLFVEDGEYLMPQDLEVDERFQGQGIAATMYDYVKSKGYKIRRSGQQTDAGAGFWRKHRPEQNVWENFHDGRNPQDKGDSKRHGVPTKASISTLRKVAKQGGRKGQLAHWMANMKSGRAKAKRK